MVPLQPREPRAVGRQPRVRIEVGARGKHLWVGLQADALQGNGDDLVARFSRATVILAHADHALALRVDFEVRVLTLRRARQRDWRAITRLAEELVVGEAREVAEIHSAVAHRVAAAAVLMHAGARVETLRRDVVDAAIGAAAHDDRASLLLRPGLDPVDVAAIELNLIETRRAGRDLRSGERRNPGAVRRDRQALCQERW